MAELMPNAKEFGLKEGFDTIARISPLFGSMATARPHILGKRFFCNDLRWIIYSKI